MNIKERIQHYRHGLTIKNVLQEYMKLNALEEQLRRYTKQAVRGEREILFDSTDLRGLALQLGKVLKAVNKKIEFVDIDKRLCRYSVITDKEFSAEMHQLVNYISAARVLQEKYSLINYLAVILDIHETKDRQSDNVFNAEVLGVLRGFLEAEGGKL